MQGAWVPGLRRRREAGVLHGAAAEKLLLEGAEGGGLSFTREELFAVEDGGEEAAGGAGRNLVGAEGAHDHLEDVVEGFDFG